MTRILNGIQPHAKLLSITGPILSVLILGGIITLIPNPATDMDFFYLFAAIICVAVLTSIGFISARMAMTDSKSRVIHILGITAIGLNVLILFLDAVFFIIVGLVGTT